MPKFRRQEIICSTVNRAQGTVLGVFELKSGEIKYAIQDSTGTVLKVDEADLDWWPQPGDRVLIAVGDYQEIAAAKGLYTTGEARFTSLIEHQARDVKWLCKEYTLHKYRGDDGILIGDNGVQKVVPLRALRVLERHEKSSTHA